MKTEPNKTDLDRAIYSSGFAMSDRERHIAEYFHQAGSWRSIADEMPRLYLNVLISKNGNIGHARYNGFMWVICASNDPISQNAVTHWMHLPSPPKK